MRIKPRRRRRTPPTTLIEFLKHLQGIRNNVICLNKSTLLLWKPVAVPLPSAAASDLVSSSLPFLSFHFGDRSLGLSLSVGGGGVSSEFWTVYGTFLQLLPTSHLKSAEVLQEADGFCFESSKAISNTTDNFILESESVSNNILFLICFWN